LLGAFAAVRSSSASHVVQPKSHPSSRVWRRGGVACLIPGHLPHPSFLGGRRFLILDGPWDRHLASTSKRAFLARQRPADNQTSCMPARSARPGCNYPTVTHLSIGLINSRELKLGLSPCPRSNRQTPAWRSLWPSTIFFRHACWSFHGFFLLTAIGHSRCHVAANMRGPADSGIGRNFGWRVLIVVAGVLANCSNGRASGRGADHVEISDLPRRSGRRSIKLSLVQHGPNATNAVPPSRHVWHGFARDATPSRKANGQFAPRTQKSIDKPCV